MDELEGEISKLKQELLQTKEELVKEKSKEKENIGGIQGQLKEIKISNPGENQDEETQQLLSSYLERIEELAHENQRLKEQNKKGNLIEK